MNIYALSVHCPFQTVKCRRKVKRKWGEKKILFNFVINFHYFFIFIALMKLFLGLLDPQDAGVILPPVTAGSVHYDNLHPDHPGLSPVRTRQSQYRDKVSLMAKSPGVPELWRCELEGREDQPDRVSHILLVSGLWGWLQLQGTFNISILHRQNFYYQNLVSKYSSLDYCKNYIDKPLISQKQFTSFNLVNPIHKSRIYKM